MPRQKKLTVSQENEILDAVDLYKSNSPRALEERYNISRSTLLNAIKRAKSRKSEVSCDQAAQ